MHAFGAVKAKPRYHRCMGIILASRSPRRLTLLQSVGLIVEVRPSHINEPPLPDESVTTMVTRLSRNKALACAAPAGIAVIGLPVRATLQLLSEIQ